MIARTLIMERLICQAGVSLSDDRIFNSRERNVACCLCLIMLTEKFCNLYTGKSEFNLVKMQKFDQIEEWVR